MSLSITGFGACMIAGYPLQAEEGFLHRAVEQLRDEGRRQVALESISMGGFPAQRACHHFAKRCLARRPDVVVLQFGSTDASAPLRNAFFLRGSLHNGSHSRGKVSDQPPSMKDLVKWRLRSLASDLLLVPSLSPLEDYLAAIQTMVAEGCAAGCDVVVVSPFVMGGGRSNRGARRYTRAQELRLRKFPRAHFLDAHDLLSRWPRRRMLLCDGFHLSPEAHQKLGRALAEMIEGIAGRRCRPAADFSLPCAAGS